MVVAIPGLFSFLFFILRGDLFLNIALYYFVPVLFSLSIPITLLGVVRANLSAFHTFVQFALISFLLFPLLFVSGNGCALLYILRDDLY